MLAMIREVLYSAVVCDALAGLANATSRRAFRCGRTQASTGTTLWADMAHPDSTAYELDGRRSTLARTMTS
jgi:hypothetical protein